MLKAIKLEEIMPYKLKEYKTNFLFSTNFYNENKKNDEILENATQTITISEATNTLYIFMGEMIINDDTDTLKYVESIKDNIKYIEVTEFDEYCNFINSKKYEGEIKDILKIQYDYTGVSSTILIVFKYNTIL